MDAQRVEQIAKLPERPIDGHKGIFGSVGIIGGCAGIQEDTEIRATMIGAPALSALGAVRAGCGLVKIGAPSPILDSVMSLSSFATGFRIQVDEHRSIIASSGAVIVDELARSCDALVVGPGMGSGSAIDQLVVRMIGQEMIPVVLDADAINALTRVPDFIRDVRAAMVLTPHPGEGRRLMDALSIEGDPSGDESERVRVCSLVAQRIGCLVVLKGHRSVVSDGHRVWVCERGHPSMGVGGTGDVLSGMIGSIIAQTKQIDDIDLFHACQIAVEAHAISGERWAQENCASGGMVPSELADLVPRVLEEMR